MNIYEDGVVCTKIKFWKKKNTIMEVVDYLIGKGYTFKELVYGEPNDFVFADEYENILSTLSRKGHFIGIRIKFEFMDSAFEINSNTNGVDNVQYDIYAFNEREMALIKKDIEEIKLIINPSNESVSKLSEFLANNPNIVKAVIIVLAIVLLYFLGVHVFLFSIINFIFSVAPIFVIFIIISLIRRRRY